VAKAGQKVSRDFLLITSELHVLTAVTKLNKVALKIEVNIRDLPVSY
jgi:hypothetical protein